MKKTIGHADEHPDVTAVGDGNESRQCGPVDPNYDPEKHLEERLSKQTTGVSLRRPYPGKK